MIEIKNYKTSIMAFDYDFSIDRRSPIGNPFFMKSEKYRDKVCDEYDDWFPEQLINGSNDFKEYLQKIKDAYLKHGKLRLFCWCVPKRCHGITIKNFLMGENNET